ncbi:glycosyltransferase [Elizabethkingia ursingii]|uniref:Glycosyl transferase n=1 Tax=Elizabethkingia ursingii TaxID=1756150 RepID=A0ABX3N737_9FLAO|nr:glycosyltransferase [Elizabethkingia ursingii]OPB86961.1 hypothetical protein BB021_10630 [Elizabethkingia ursingii]
MKLLVVINNLGNGGAEKLLVDNLPVFSHKYPDLEITVLQLTQKGSDPFYIEYLEDHRIHVDYLSVGSPYNPLLISKFIKYVSTKEFDVIHVHLFPSLYCVGIASRLSKNLKNIVFTEHSINNRRLSNVFFRPFDQFIYKSYDKIITISPLIENKLVNWLKFNKHKFIVIRNGIDLDKINKITRYTKAELISETGVSKNSKTLLMAARFNYPKDQKTVIDSLKYLPEDYCIIFAGDGIERGACMEYVLKNNLTDKVFFIGFRSDVLKLMKSVDLNILSSNYEGMSGVTCEALASGIPFLGSNVMGINDIVPNEGFLFEPRNSKSLSFKIKNILENIKIKEQMLVEAKEITASFNNNIMIQEHYNLYKEIIKMNKG